MKRLAWIPAFVLSAGIHAALLIPALPRFVEILSARSGKPANPGGEMAVLGFAIGWCVIVGAWSALVTNVLSSPTNKWGGLGGFKLVGIVVGFTLALDLLDSPCLFSCPPIALVLPILSYVAIFNNSMAPDGQSGTGGDAIA